MSSVFDDIDRTTSGAASRITSAFNYLNTSNRAEAERVRVLVNDLIQRYPETHRDELKHRLRSVDNITHVSAFFELALHELLLRAGCTIIAVEPTIPGTSKKPDFLVEAPTGEQFYMEATLATGRSAANVAAQNRLNHALEIIDSMGSPEYFLDLSITGMPTENIAASKLRRLLRRWLERLNYDDVVVAWEQNAAPSFEYEKHGVTFQIRPYPRNGTRGDSTERAIGVQSLEPLVGSPGGAIYEAVKGKAGRYGNLPLPYIIAVNAMGNYMREDHALDALFGSPAVELYQDANGPQHREIRNPDGAWMGPAGPQYTRVSAVLSTERVDPWHIGTRRARLILNPWAAKPAQFLDLEIDRREVNLTDDRLITSNGRSLQEILELPETWPE